MAGSTNKKIVIRRFDRDPVAGFVNPQSYLHPGGIEGLAVEGSLLYVPYEEVKTIYFVRDFETAEPWTDMPRLFLNRPKSSGVWVRMTFRDGDVLDGLLPNNLLTLEPYGFTLVPPGAGQQRIFVPRAALTEMLAVGVVGGLRVAKPKPKPKQQISLFE
ncbi:MAG: DUF6982 domain-containing protein [Acidobacteriota bacterium]